MASPTTSSSQDLPALGQAFEAYLDATDLYPGITSVRGVAQAGRIVLIARHHAPEIEHPRALLRELEAAFAELMPSVGLPDAAWAEIDAVPVRICLQLGSAEQPYATHTFTWRVEDAATAVFPPAGVAPEGADGATPLAQADGEAEVGVDSSAADTAPPVDPDGEEVNGVLAGPATGAMAGDIDGDSAAANGRHGPSAPSALGEAAAPEDAPFSDQAIALPDASIEPPDNFAWLRGGWNFSLNQLRNLSQYWIYGLTGMILLGSGLFAYALSRPCVVGSCDRLNQAETLYEDAQVQMAGTPDSDALLTAQSDLQAAITLLEPIPHWSAYYTMAQANLQQYQRDVADLNALVQAQKTAFEAATLSQNPPHPVDHWVDVQMLWQQAINLLENVSPDSPTAAYAQQKLQEYQANHKVIGRRIVAEEEAEANFSTAIQTGQLAQQRMDTAESLAGWQLAAKEWQAAIKGLSLIPQGTSAYSEAQTYLQEYRQKLSRTSAQANLEESSTRFYQQAVQAAREAKGYEAKNQWTLAVTEWRRAVTSAQQISPESTLGSEATVLAETYQPALTNAQNRLRTAVALQNLTQTVGSVCAGSATPCSVTDDPSQIQITLSSQYAEPLRRAITPPAADGTFAFTNELSVPAQQLIEQIMTISHQVDRQVAIYDAHGGFVARYRPDLGGFIKN